MMGYVLSLFSKKEAAKLSSKAYFLMIKWLTLHCPRNIVKAKVIYERQNRVTENENINGFP